MSAQRYRVQGNVAPTGYILSPPDKGLMIITGFLALFGIMMILSAGASKRVALGTNPGSFAIKQLICFFIGFWAMCKLSRYNYKKLEGIAVKFAWIVVVLLLLIDFTPLGVTVNGAKRWLALGPLQFQPSEIAKICFVMFSASYFSKNPAKSKTFLGCLPVLAAGGVVCFLIILEPNMSITVCFGLLTLAILFAAGMKTSHFIILLVPAALCVPLLIIAEPYRLNRLSAFLNPWASPKGEGYQLLQSLYALGSGGWFGTGLFKSRQKLRFLPFSESDFILSVIGEEIGFIGLLFFFGLIFFIVIRGIRIAVKSKDYYGYILAVGITCVYGIQSLVNALVVTGSIPPTGLPLPLVSAGNTSLIVFLYSFGVLYNISKN